MRLVIAEKHSVAQAIGQALGDVENHDGYIKAGGNLISWAQGHLVNLAMPDEYDGEPWADPHWSMDTLPIAPSEWKWSVNHEKGADKRYRELISLASRDDVDTLVNACDPDREGEAIFRRVMNHACVHKPALRLWVASLDEQAIRDAWNAMKPEASYRGLGDAADATPRMSLFRSFPSPSADSTVSCMGSCNRNTPVSRPLRSSPRTVCRRSRNALRDMRPFPLSRHLLSGFHLTFRVETHVSENRKTYISPGELDRSIISLPFRRSRRQTTGTVQDVRKSSIYMFWPYFCVACCFWSLCFGCFLLVVNSLLFLLLAFGVPVAHAGSFLELSSGFWLRSVVWFCLSDAVFSCCLVLLLVVYECRRFSIVSLTVC